MSDYSPRARAIAMREAGFSPSSIPMGLAISLGEWGGGGSGINNTADPSGPDYAGPPAPGNLPEYSVGPWQINLLAHPEVTPAQAMDLGFSTNFAYRLSNGGTHWTPWGAYTNGSWRNHLADARNAIDGGGDDGGTTPEVPGGAVGPVGPTGPQGPSGPATPPSSGGGITPSGWQCAQILALSALPKAQLSAITGIPEDQLQAAAYACAKGAKDTKLPGEEQADALGQIGGFFGLLTRGVTNGPAWYKVGFVVVGTVAIVTGFRLYMKHDPERVNSQATGEEGTP